MLLFGGRCLQDSNSSLCAEERERANNRITQLRSRCTRTFTEEPNKYEANNGNQDLIPGIRPLNLDERGTIRKSREILSTSTFKDKGERRNQDENYSHSASRTLRKRVRLQEKEFSRISRTVHNGGKDDFCLALGLSVSDSRKRRIIEGDDEGWNGRLSVDDLIDVLKRVKGKKCGRQQSLYDFLIKSHSAEHYYITADELLMIVDTKSVQEIISYLRKRLPGFLASEKATRTLKAQLNDGMRILEPKSTATGMSINPMRIRQCLLYLYHWLPAGEWWRLFGDASKLGQEQTTLMCQ